MKWTLVPFLLFCLAACTSKPALNMEKVDFGTSEYYSPFLWEKSDTLTLLKTLRFEFNEHALASDASIRFQWVDRDGKPLSGMGNTLMAFCNGKEMKEGQAILKASQLAESNDVSLGLKFLPGFPEGKHSGFLQVVSTDLDRVDNISMLPENPDKRILQWQAAFDETMNPLLLALLILMAFILFSLATWFAYLRDQRYPKLKKGRLQFHEPYYKNVEIKGRYLILTNSPKKHSFFDQKFKGQTRYEINPEFTDEIIFAPDRKGRPRVKLPIGYKIDPADRVLRRYSEYKITTNTNESIKFQYH